MLYVGFKQKDSFFFLSFFICFVENYGILVCYVETLIQIYFIILSLIYLYLYYQKIKLAFSVCAVDDRTFTILQFLLLLHSYCYKIR